MKKTNSLLVSLSAVLIVARVVLRDVVRRICHRPPLAVRDGCAEMSSGSSTTHQCSQRHYLARRKSSVYTFVQNSWSYQRVRLVSLWSLSKTGGTHLRSHTCTTRRVEGSAFAVPDRRTCARSSLRMCGTWVGGPWAGRGCLGWAACSKKTDERGTHFDFTRWAQFARLRHARALEAISATRRIAAPPLAGRSR